MSDTGGGRNFYYSGKFEGESDIDVIERLALVNERDFLKKEVAHCAQQLRWVSAELDAYKSVLQRKRAEENDND
jgi:hypothetical protein